MRILCVTPWFPNTPEDGRFNFILHSVDALCKEGVELSILVPRPYTPGFFGLFKEEWQRPRLQRERFNTAYHLEECHYVSVPRNFLHYQVWESYRRWISPKIEAMAKKVSAEVIHVHTEAAAFAAVPAARKLGIPVVITLHGINLAPRQLDTQQKRDRLQRTLGSADRIVLVGEPLRAYFAPLAGGDDNFCVVPNGFFLPEVLQSVETRESETSLKLISISNLQEGKGIDLNLQSLALFDQRGFRDWRYTIVGGGDERPRLERMTAEMGLQERVTFLGHLPHREALAQLRDAEIFLLPSYREAFGVAYLEAMAAGLLTIGVKGQGPEAFIVDGLTGFLLAPGDAFAITACLESIVQKREQCRAIAVRGRAVVATEFTWQRHAQKLIDVYAEVVIRSKNSKPVGKSLTR